MNSAVEDTAGAGSQVTSSGGSRPTSGNTNAQKSLFAAQDVIQKLKESQSFVRTHGVEGLSNVPEAQNEDRSQLSTAESSAFSGENVEEVSVNSLGSNGSILRQLPPVIVRK